MNEILARDLLRRASGTELLERLDHLDAIVRTKRATPARAPRAPLRGDHHDCDVLIAGGGLWSLLAPLLAKRGRSVAVVDRARVGAAHREWNASRKELESLVRVGLLTHEELDALIVARYARGFCRFGAGPQHTVHGVLDCAVDASGLLSLVRRKGERLGVTYIDRTSVQSETASDAGVRASLVEGERRREMTCRTLIDARGSSSPYATFDLVCPTVGGVMRGFDQGHGPNQVDPTTGEILVTVDGLDRGIQYVWELFPGAEGEATVYLFYYAERDERGSLLDLYARFFDRLQDYKSGDAKLVRPTFGYIPGWSRLVPPSRSPHRNIVLVGDAAARHSPLTYCGFGSMLRRLAPTVDAIATSESWDVEEPIHALTGLLAHILASRTLRGQAMNELLDAAFSTLGASGEPTYASLLNDTMLPSAFVRFLRETARRYPSVWPTLARTLGVRGTLRFSRVVGGELIRGGSRRR